MTALRTDRLDDLSMNETPYPPLPALQRVVADGTGRLNRYPDHAAAALTAGLARWLDVRPEAVLVGPGSAGLCQHLVQALGPRPDVVYPALSFEGFPLIVRKAGANGVPVPMDGYRHDLPAMAAAVTGTTRCVLICNPNNPTGAVLHRAELAEFLDRIPSPTRTCPTRWTSTALTATCACCAPSPRRTAWPRCASGTRWCRRGSRRWRG
jgi:histidinol-phosphate aminotransferase